MLAVAVVAQAHTQAVVQADQAVVVLVEQRVLLEQQELQILVVEAVAQVLLLVVDLMVALRVVREES
jgi:hypothetical protein